jgi:hypothetical protein
VSLLLIAVLLGLVLWLVLLVRQRRREYTAAMSPPAPRTAQVAAARDAEEAAAS